MASEIVGTATVMMNTLHESARRPNFDFYER
jgi:hypothetical protein